LFIGYVVAVSGILFAALLLVVALVDPRGFSALRGVALDATGTVSAGGRSVVRLFTNGGETIGNYVRAGAQNEALKRELEASRARLVEAQALKLENERLKQLLRLSGETRDAVTTGRIVGSSFQSARRMAILSAGSKDGVLVGQPVRSSEGLLGRVLETGRFVSRVLLVTDGASNVPVRLIRDGTPAMATGRGDGTIEIKPLEVGANRFRRGDLFVTSGTGGIFPPNIPAAVVIRTNRDETIARPIADPARIEFAIVEQMYLPPAAAESDTAPLP
jgi:rod shape-determining protein MreC